MSMSQTRQPTPRRLQIADAALGVIAAQGLGRFTTAAIAAEIGVTDGSLFRHFASKEEIVLAALDRAEERLFDGFPPDDALPLSRLERFFRHRAALVREAPVIARLAFSDELGHAAGPASAAQVEGWRARSLAFVAGCLEDARALGHAPAALESRAVALIVLGALMALSRLGQGAPELTDAVWAALTTSWGGATDRPEQRGEP